ncbi:hypothetical protein PSEUBRA_002713 [Kalmanozyma brasiliensis GHG001]|uniref:Uncharacterized protein n=1 Tax=Kalmanozyma brasiliensis (strain GHG001) TaxID=1365824 RepID=V5EWB7_KALBG|nr:uncharacterized protein PSEUBRA_002713 [Kalmanozyma brasiliensis GHG001]EST07623.1 hypothetical protein PSEUBRA_002713 [Kalmanozyma brasiliensis GHG001]
MSQLGSTEPASASLDTKPSLPPAKVPTDDEAEEGEILDEEEGEISESRPDDADTSVSTPAPPTSAITPQTVEQPPEQAPSAQVLAAPAAAVESIQQEDEAQSAPAASVEDVTQPTTQASQPTEQTEAAAEVAQLSAADASAPAAEPTTDAAVTDPVPDAVITPAPRPAELPTQPQEPVETTTAPPENADPVTPKLTEAQAPLSDAPVAAPSNTQDQAMEDAPAAAKDLASTEPQADAVTAEVAPTADEPADMDVDEKIVIQAPPTNEAVEFTADVGQDAMQVDSTVHTPALPSDGPETPAAPTAALPAEERDEPAASVDESAIVKSEPQSEAQEQPQLDTVKDVEVPLAGPVDAQPQSVEEQAQKEEATTTTLDAHPEPQQEQAAPSAPLEGDAPSTLDRPRSEEVPSRSTVERPERSASRPAESRSTNRNSAAPSSIPGRVERERTKDRSHPPSERSQDREQRAREKDRRRELERLERERERERERIRESERDREMMIARENEEARLIWLSLPGNDHPQYYTDTDSDSCYGGGGAFGVDLTDEEDKDLDPPLPRTAQEFYPPPTYGERNFDDLGYGGKRKRGDDGDGTSSRRSRHGAVPAAERFAPSTAPRDAHPSTMINIDDFPIPDSDVRGSPSDRPFTSQISRPLIPAHTPSHHEDDDSASSSDEESSRIASERKRRHGHRSGNRGNKLSREKGARWIRRGKLGGFTEMRMEKEIGDRVRHRVEAMQKDNVRALLSAMPAEDKAMLSQFPVLKSGLMRDGGEGLRDGKGRLLASDISEAARIDAVLGLDGGKVEREEHLTSTSLAPTLLKPAITPRQVLTSHTLRHTFRNPHIAALGKTALDLIESEGVVGRAVGRCWAAMERGGWNEDPEPKGDEADEDGAANGMDVEEDEGAGTLFGSPIDNPALSHLDRLFVTKQGLAIPRLDDVGQPIFVPPSPATQAARTQAGVSEEAAHEAVIETTLLPAPEQRSIVLAALECLHDLAADSREYVERLEEVRSRLAAVKRRRAQVWNAVRQWALDKDVEAEQGSGARLGETVAVAVANGGSPRKRK